MNYNHLLKASNIPRQKGLVCKVGKKRSPNSQISCMFSLNIDDDNVINKELNTRGFRQHHIKNGGFCCCSASAHH